MRASAQADLDGLPIPDVTLEAPSVSLSADLSLPKGDDDDSKKKKKDKDDTSGKSKSSFFGGLFKFKLPDFSGFKFEGKPSSVEVDKLMKDLPEPDDYAEEEQDWTLLFGRLRQGKDQEEVEHDLLGLLKLLYKRLKASRSNSRTFTRSRIQPRRDRPFWTSRWSLANWRVKLDS
ncbi:uncharacterized protein LOC131889904 [Tigriopus californicus]|uniref:uncharacterized protein LOC131889904 n=1 Tax=Tigriopus californicus TaxID=6832 RepID=UPI0027DA422A|nr:uncharacterized protein LOC131889904 [Tigriopus californicus]XP_059095111.1 uncharacterized protein LOC131889904 [Tigriopus californicus]